MSLLANHALVGRVASPPILEHIEGATQTSTSVTLAFDSTPTDGRLLLFVYRTTSGAPSTLPAGVALLSSIDNNGLGLYVYTKTASSESNSYEFGDASSNEKNVIGVCISNFVTGATVVLTADSGAGNVASINMPSSGTHTYTAGTLIIAPLVTLALRSITRTPFDSALGIPDPGPTFNTYAAFRSLPNNSSHQIQFTLNSGTRAKAMSITVI